MQKIITFLSFLLFVFLMPFFLRAQKNMLGSQKLSTIISKTGGNEWIYFKDNIEFNPLDFFIKYKNNFEFSDQDEIKFLKNTSDKEPGLTHYFFQQYHLDIPVMHAQINVHTKHNFAYKANGKIVRNLTVPNTISISSESALQVAVTNFSAVQFSQKGETKKVYLPKDFDFENTDPSSMVLCYQIELQTYINRKGTNYFIDANTGKIIGAVPTVYNCSPTTASTVWYGSKAISTSLKSSTNKYYLKDDCNATKVEVLLGKNGRVRDTIFSGVGSNTWASNSNAVTALWVAKRTTAYFSSVHQRASWDNANHPVVFVIDDPNCTDATCTKNNAYAGDTITFGNYSTAALEDDYYTLDVFGHEFTHNVTASAIPGGLVYNRESGALNESFSDIIGNCVEMWEEGVVTGDIWKIGEDRNNAGGALWLRDMANPNNSNPNTTQSSPQPKKYLSTNYWQDASASCIPNNPNDQCGVHYNSGVQNYMFYLLSAGGSGINEGIPFDVSGITVIKSRTIAYATLTGGYLTSTSNYLSARNAWIQAAEDLYGICSNEAIQTAKAWYAVGADINSPFYDKISGCININSSAGLTITGGINSYTLSPGGCALIIQTATNNPLIFQAGNYISIKPGVVLTRTASQPLTVAPNECAFSNY